MNNLNQPLTNKCIILDLDETLVYTPENERLMKEIMLQMGTHLREKFYDISFPVPFSQRGSGQSTRIVGIKRNFLSDFLSFCFSYFRIVAVWSAGRKDYVERVVSYIFRDIAYPHIVYTYDDCREDSHGKIDKPIYEMVLRESVPGKKYHLSDYMTLENTFFLDDQESYTKENPTNAIIIPAFNPSLAIDELFLGDDALYQLTKWLMRDDVINANDVRYLDKRSIFSFR
jgi:hypothetical protein